MKSFPNDPQGALGAPFPRQRERENASGERWAGNGGLCLEGSRIWEGSQRPGTQQRVPPIPKGNSSWKAGWPGLLCPRQPSEVKQSPGKAKVHMEAMGILMEHRIKNPRMV